MFTIVALLIAQTIAQPPANVPGAIDPRVTQSNIKTTICVSGYTDSVRPPSEYTNRIKFAQMRLLGIRLKPSQVEADHRVALGSGGCPTCQSNIWAQPHPQHAWKNRLERNVQRDICAKHPRLTLAEGQAIFLGDWYAEYVRRYGKRKQ